jgi:predicted aspartyl protease
VYPFNFYIEEIDMSIFSEEITLENPIDVGNVRQGFIKKSEVRRLTVKALVDTCAWTLVINEKTRAKLGLVIEGSIGATLADGSTSSYDLTEGVKIRWKDRSTTQQALVVPNADSVLLGALPLEAMDLMADSVNEHLVGVHGDKALYILKSISPA